MRSPVVLPVSPPLAHRTLHQRPPDAIEPSYIQNRERNRPPGLVRRPLATSRLGLVPLQRVPLRHVVREIVQRRDDLPTFGIVHAMQPSRGRSESIQAVGTVRGVPASAGSCPCKSLTVQRSENPRVTIHHHCETSDTGGTASEERGSLVRPAEFRPCRANTPAHRRPARRAGHA